ncbi:hypothetical protein RN607_07785 [Demequina capsici]|uniref:Uncharacterized protein n=1 Tax=Demequina capsici TaxID=3075620 RepID=A0AA96F5M6_9MICO|nr:MULTISPECIES: hypothetical protein [unclassified Demequina]WNM23222.1 hypothetical protein RN606_07545 [Demequina sp. OYTSA14]WNM26101.1 hypothetical protein RN607_07785 [Demequina sp. PMTSA13]
MTSEASPAAVGAVAELESLRWWLLRWGPRADSGVILAAGPADDEAASVDVATLAVALPVMALTGDFAPADMQYRMHRELLWDEATGMWAASCSVDEHGAGIGSRPPVTQDATAMVVETLDKALRLGGDAVPAEMRGRWAQQLAELRDALSRG